MTEEIRKIIIIDLDGNRNTKNLAARENSQTLQESYNNLFLKLY